MPRRAVGRPPLGRVRHPYRVPLEDVVLGQLVEQSQLAGYPRTTYLERVVALAHGYDSPFLPPPVVPLPTAVPGEVLQRHVRRLQRRDCSPVRSDTRTGFAFLRLDSPLREQLVTWCEKHDVDYGSYLRAILRLAAGFHSVDQLRPRHVQPELLDALDTKERPKAS